MNLKTIQTPSPNFDSRNGHEVDMLVLHYTGMKSAHEALERLCNPTAKVSAHYMVDEDGTIYQLVDKKNQAWHAGISHWRGNSNINQRSIGIEIVNKGHEFGYTPFPDRQMQAVISLCRDIIARHNIPPRNIVGHSDIAPTRKQDPGELFNWKLLAENGIGLFPVNITNEKQPAESLQKYGYDVTDLEKAIVAFQRHFRPCNLSGTWDDECGKILAVLITFH